MRVLLINPPDDLQAFLGKGKDFVPTFEPLGLLYISAVCKQYGYTVFVIDAFAEKLSIEQIKNAISKMCPDVIGFTSFISNGNVIYELGRWIKKEYPRITVIFGNIHASVYATPYIANGCCDVVVHGEGEYTFLKILEVLDKSRGSLSDIPSISYRHNGKVITTSGPSVIEDLSALPLPDRDAVRQQLYNISYLSNLPYFAKKNSIAKHMFTARGCIYSCSFCVIHNKMGQRCNSISKVADEIEMLVGDRYRANYIFIMDSIFTSNKRRVIDICKEIKKRNIKLKWGCEGHVNFIDKELVEEMESAGCHDIAFGIESGVQRILNGVQKGTTIERIVKAVNTVKKNTKILVSGLFVLGLPGETYRDSLQTIAFAKKLPLDMAQFSILVPYPGSPIFYELKNKGEIDTGIRLDGTLDPSVWLRYSPYISFTSNKPIWVTPTLNPQTLKRLQKKALRDFYLRPRKFLLQLKRLRMFNILTTLEAFFKTFF